MSAFGVKRTCRFALHMSAYDPKRTLPSAPRLIENLSVFDDFCLALAARLALERVLVMVRLIGLDADKPHRCAAPYASRMIDFLV